MRATDPERRQWWLLGAMSGVLGLIVLDETIVAVSLPDIARDLGLSLSAAHWVVNAYLLSFTCAVAIAGRRLLARGKTWKTAGLIEEAWKSAPHPDLAALYAQIKPSESAERRLARFNGLFELNRDHAESRIHFSQLAVACGKWLAARDALGPIAMEAPTAHI